MSVDTSDVFGRAVERHQAERAPLHPLAGVGVFTAEAPRLALALAGVVRSVALRPDLATPADADSLREHFQVFVWEDLARDGQQAVERFDAIGYIGQAESSEQRARALALSPLPDPPRALVGSWFDAGWTSLLECYGVSVPSDLGAGFPVLGLFGGSTLADYLPSLGSRRDFWLFRVETMGDADADTLRQLASAGSR